MTAKIRVELLSFCGQDRFLRSPIFRSVLRKARVEESLLIFYEEFRRGADRLNIWLLAPSSMGERVGRCKGSTTGDVLKVFAAFRVFLPPFGLIGLFGSIPGWPARSGSFELGTSRVVGKQGERGAA